MQIRYRELMGKRVIGSDGQKVGRVADIIAHHQGDQLEVSALRVGATGLLHRIAFRRAGDGRQGLDEVPWEMVESIGKTIRLNATAQAARDARDEQANSGTSKGKGIPA